MAESKSKGFRWLLALVGLALVVVFTWLGLSEAPSGIPSIPVAAAGAPRIEEHGRLTLQADALPDTGTLRLSLDLPDEARGSEERTVRVASVDGRRFDTKATPLPGEGSGVQLEIDSDFLAPGRYLIEIDTVGTSPLRIRRYVLELQ